MIGALILAIVIVVVLPVAFLMSGAMASVLMGRLLRTDAEHRYEGSELLHLDG